MEAKRDRQQEAENAQHVKKKAPPSSLSSPSHEFSFTISLRHPENIPEKSPADEIFSYGHLQSLHLPISPRTSTNSRDRFTLPPRELSGNNSAVFSSRESRLLEEKTQRKSKSFSLFGLPRRKKDDADTEAAGEGENLNRETKKRKLKFELMKRYIRFVKPFLASLRSRGVRSPTDRRPFSYSSGNQGTRSNRKVRGRRGEVSAPASMRISPANSGYLVTSGACTPSLRSDSTMEELQAAIQAAIAHCKDSIAAQDNKMKVP